MYIFIDNDIIYSSYLSNSPLCTEDGIKIHTGGSLVHLDYKHNSDLNCYVYEKDRRIFLTFFNGEQIVLKGILNDLCVVSVAWVKYPFISICHSDYTHIYYKTGDLIYSKPGRYIYDNNLNNYAVYNIYENGVLLNNKHYYKIDYLSSVAVWEDYFGILMDNVLSVYTYNNQKVFSINFPQSIPIGCNEYDCAISYSFIGDYIVGSSLHTLVAYSRWGDELDYDSCDTAHFFDWWCMHNDKIHALTGLI